MALIIEDGTGKTDSNSYASVSDVRAYAQARGVTLPTEDSSVESLIIRGMDYLEAQRDRYQGEKTYPDHPQALQWPRKCVEIDSYPWPEDAIPKELVAALSQCSMEIFAGNDLQPTTGTEGRVKKERVEGAVEREFMTATDMGSTGFAPSFPKVDALLAPLFGTGGAALRTVRV